MAANELRIRDQLDPRVTANDGFLSARRRRLAVLIGVQRVRRSLSAQPQRMSFSLGRTPVGANFCG